MAKYVKSVNKRDGKIHIEKNDKLYLDGVLITEENIGEIPLDVAIAFFANRAGSNFGSVEYKLGKSVVERLRAIANDPLNNPDLVPFRTLAQSEEAESIVNTLNPMVKAEDGAEARKYSNGLGVESAKDLADPKKLGYSVGLLAMDVVVSQQRSADFELQLAQYQDEKLAEKLAESQERVKALELQLANTQAVVPESRKEKKVQDKEVKELKAEIERVNAIALRQDEELRGKRVRIATLEKDVKKYKEDVKDLEKVIGERDEHISVLNQKVTSEANKAKRAKKSRKRAIIAAAIFLGTTITSLTGNIVQGIKNRQLENQNNFYITEIDKKDNDIAFKDNQINYKDTVIRDQASQIADYAKVAEKYGYKAGMTDENGNVITVKDFLENLINKDVSDIEQEIADLKQTIKDLGYSVDENKSASDIMKDIYGAFQDEKMSAVSSEVLASYMHFAELLKDLGISSSDILDENGNLATDKFDKSVEIVVGLAVKNAGQLQNIQAKLETMFDQFAIEGEVSDYPTLADAMQEVFDAYEEQNNTYKEMINNAIQTAFDVAGLKKENGDLYSPADFASEESAIQFLGANCKEGSAVDIKPYLDQIDELKKANEELGKQVSSLTKERDEAQETAKNQEAIANAIQGKYDKLQGLYNEATTKIGTLEAENKELKDEVSRLNTELIAVDAQLQSLQLRYDALDEEYSSVKTRLESEISRLETEYAGKVAELNQAYETIEANEETIASQEEIIAQLREVVDALSNSKDQQTSGKNENEGNTGVSGEEKDDNSPIDNEKPNPSEDEKSSGTGSGSSGSNAGSNEQEKEESNFGRG